ncbi:hypothetical protein ACQJBY_058302 [Aegilops geniculata]
MRPLPHFLLHRVTIFGGAMAAARASAFCSSRSCRHRQEGVPDRTPTRGPPLRRPVVSGLRPPRWPSCWLALWCPIHSLPVTHQITVCDAALQRICVCNLCQCRTSGGWTGRSYGQYMYHVLFVLLTTFLTSAATFRRCCLRQLLSSFRLRSLRHYAFRLQNLKQIDLFITPNKQLRRQGVWMKLSA